MNVTANCFTGMSIMCERDCRGAFMKKFLCGFYCEPLRWTISASTEQDAAAKFAKMIKRKRLRSVSGTKEFVVFEAAGY